MQCPLRPLHSLQPSPPYSEWTNIFLRDPNTQITSTGIQIRYGFITSESSGHVFIYMVRIERRAALPPALMGWPPSSTRFTSFSESRASGAHVHKSNHCQLMICVALVTTSADLNGRYKRLWNEHTQRYRPPHAVTSSARRWLPLWRRTYKITSAPR